MAMELCPSNSCELERNTFGDKQAGGAVSEIVETNLGGQGSLLEESLKNPVHRIGLDRLAVPRGEDEITVTPVGTGYQPLT